MTKTDFDFNTPMCAVNGCSELSVDIHELAGGKTANKKVGDRATCINNHIQLPLCRDCHNKYESDKKQSFITGCDILDIDAEYTRLAINNYDRTALSFIKSKCIEYYDINYGLSLK